MKIVELSEISPCRISVNCRSFIRHVHHLKELSVRGRSRSAFMLVTDGDFHYEFDGGELTLLAGEILYIPEGGHYRYRVNEGRTECLQIEAEISVDGERAAFSDRPVKLTDGVSRMREMMETLENRAGDLEKNAAVFALLGAFLGKKDRLPHVSARILPAVRYLREHCNEVVYMGDVAALCHLSQSQVRRLFRRELGVSPVEYKNRCRAELACEMLRYTHNNVSEVAESLGFDSVYVFSNTFRKYVGVSPSQYRKAQAAEDVF